MTAEQRIKRQILVDCAKHPENGLDLPEAVDATNVDDLYHATEDLYDAESEFRSSGEETDVPCDWSRHYESKSVARRLDDGTWVGWTFWYGGGKHGEPGDIEWMNGAYLLDVKEEQKLVTVREFTKVGA